MYLYKCCLGVQLDQKTIAIKGTKGSFHELACHGYFNGQQFNTLECNSFEDLCGSLNSAKSDFAIMAIENSLSGSILPNYNLLSQYDFSIVGEIFVRIHLHLMTYNQNNIEKLKTVHSHYVALSQCSEFLKKYPNLHTIEGANTAVCAKQLATSKNTDAGVIASRISSEQYGLKILAENIETNKNNYTRFFILSKNIENKPTPEANKISLTFQVSSYPGALVKALTTLEEQNVNMSKIQSVPVIGEPNKYAFHCDANFPNLQAINATIESLKKETINFKVLGIYKEGQTVEA